MFRRKRHMKGTVKWYNSRKGYGFIKGEDEKDIFVHRSAIPEDLFLNADDEVEFDMEDSEKGPQATNIKKV